MVWLPQRKSAGSPPAAARRARAWIACWAGRTRAEAATAKICGIGKRGRQRELLARHRKPTPNEDAASRRKRDGAARIG
jgi:hypothetical protein